MNKWKPWEGNSKYEWQSIGKSNGQPPFQFISKEQRVVLRVPSFASVQVKSFGFWKSIYDGIQLLKREVYPESISEMALSLPEGVEVRIVFSFGEWIIRPVQKPTSLKARFFPWVLAFRNRSVQISVLGHVLLIAFLLTLGVRENQQNDSGAADLNSEEMSGESQEASGSMKVAKSNVNPYQGVRYSQFYQWLVNAKGTATEKADLLLEGFSPSKAAGKNFQSGSAIAVSAGALEKINTGRVGNSSTSYLDGFKRQGAMARRQQLMVDKKNESNSISEAQRKRVKQALANAQDDITRVYSQSLILDPSLSGSASLEMKVNAAGYLSLSHMKLTSKTESSGYRKLVEGVGEVISKIFVGKDLSGSSFKIEWVLTR